jgi:hypothetical protein
MQTTSELLAEFAELLNKEGADSEAVCAFLSEHSHDSDFAELAEISRKLKKALIAPLCNGTRV